MSYDLWKRNYPQPDENLADEFECFRYDTLEEANKAVNELEERYSDDVWEGHPLYKAKLYIEESVEYETPSRNVWDFIETGPSIYYE